MSESDIRDQLKDALAAVHQQEPPAFDDIWAAAELRHLNARRRYAIISGIAVAIAMVAVVAGLWSLREAVTTDEFLIADSLLNTTQWAAPSDALCSIGRAYEGA